MQKRIQPLHKTMTPEVRPPIPEHPPAPERPNLALEYFRYRMARYKRFWLVALAVFALDQITKFAVLAWIPPRNFDNPVVVIPGFFNLVHVYNRGAAFSILVGYGWLLVLFAAGALAAIFHWRRHLQLEKKSSQWIFGLMAGGIVGNVIDRMLHGHVVDFLDVVPPGFSWLASTFLGWPPESHWPAFNIADCGICIGVFLFLGLSFFEPRKGTLAPKSGKEEPPTAPPPP
jgi:signal peptidase II